MSRDSHHPSEDQLRRKFWLLFLRIVALCGIVTMTAELIHTHGPIQELEGELYLGATAIFLVGLFWKRVYTNPFLQWQAYPFAFLTAYVGALIRHSHFSRLYAGLFIVTEALGVIGWLLSGHKGPTPAADPVIGRKEQP